jgi:dephospho-CoA kinase
VSIVVGLTGNIACGKSAVGAILKQEGIPVIDSDDIVHQLYEQDPIIQDQIKKVFGTLDRKVIAEMVFGSEPEKQANKKKLEAILHPAVAEKFSFWVKKNLDAPLVVNLVPLLFEANLQGRYDCTVCVVSDEKHQIDRLKKRNPELSENQIKARIQSQMPQKQKAELADYIILNNSSLEDLHLELKALVSKITSIKSI